MSSSAQWCVLACLSSAELVLLVPLLPQEVISSHKKLMYYAAVLSQDSFVGLWNDVQAAAAASAPKQGEEEKDIWDAPAAVGENDDEEGYE